MAPPWLETMRTLIGTKEVPGPGNNPEILRWASDIASRFPDMTPYCRQFTNDAIPWCGLTVGYVMAMNGIRPPFASGDTGKFLWANAWASWGTKLDKPVPGAVMVFTRNGGGHVTLYEAEDADYYHVCGGNQSDMVNVARYPRRQLTCAVWPPGVPMPGDTPVVAAPPIAPEDEVPTVDPATPAPTVEPSVEPGSNSPVTTVIVKTITQSGTFWASIFGKGGALATVIAALSDWKAGVIIGAIAAVGVLGWIALHRYQQPDIRKGRP